MHGVDATEVFERVSHPTRVEILDALASAQRDAPADPWLAYTELREAVGIRDNGNLNYHLDQLGDLVVKEDAGYRLSRVGMGLVGTASSGVLDTDWTWGPVDVPGECRQCGDPLQLRYEDGVLWLTCDTDGHEHGLWVPPSLLEAHPEDTLVERIAFLENRWGELTRRGICSECQGNVDGELTRLEDGGHHFLGHCDRCGSQHGLPVGLFLVGHPDVQRFYYEHDVDVRSTPYWTLDFCRPGAETVVSTDPLRVRVDVTHDGDTLSLTLDRAGDVVATDRS
ncbi:winged helix-turn-helix domain-containing protein [Haloarchaeobius baliensis]|uniref:winged helix-turn-helix domain-containing protein n=1 Tax=Haloarchaeobius baliensis TaxID=1670458 RepID=UPI003F881483